MPFGILNMHVQCAYIPPTWVSCNTAAILSTPTPAPTDPCPHSASAPAPDINECIELPTVCTHTTVVAGSCVNLSGSYTCNCTEDEIANQVGLTFKFRPEIGQCSKPFMCAKSASASVQGLRQRVACMQDPCAPDQPTNVAWEHPKCLPPYVHARLLLGGIAHVHNSRTDRTLLAHLANPHCGKNQPTLCVPHVIHAC